MDLKLTPKVLQSFSDKDSKKPHFRSLYEQHDFLTAYAKHTDLRVLDDPQWAIGRGDEWESHGAMQLEFLKSEGLKPEHHLLDLGCGVGRAARKFVPYLDQCHYIGVDISQEALAHAAKLAHAEGWYEKSPMFLLTGDLELEWTFNFIWAHSVFTHLPPQQIAVMIERAAALLNENGRFLFTYRKSTGTGRTGLKQFCYGQSFFEDLAAKHGFQFETHPKVWPATQHTIRLTKL